MAPLVDLSGVNMDEEKSYQLKWVDEAYSRPLAEENLDEDDLINLQNPPAINSHRETRQLKSGLKGSRLNLTQKN